MQNITSINYQHKILLERYTQTVLETIKLITGTNESKYNDFLDVYTIIIDYHNEYKNGLEPGNYLDFLSIIPTNLSIAVQGFLVGIENKRNSARVRAIKLLLNNLAFELVSDMEYIKIYED